MDLWESQLFDGLVLLTGQRDANGGKMKACLLKISKERGEERRRWPPCYHSTVR